MLTVQPAKNLQGKLDLPPSPDLFVLGVVVALARRTAVRISPLSDIPVVREWESILRGHATFTWTADECVVVPVTDDPSIRIGLASVDIPYRDLIVFTLLGMGKTIVFTSIGALRCDSWKKQAHRFGYTITIEPYGTATCLQLTDAAGAPAPAMMPMVDECDLQPLFGLLLGTSGKLSFLSETPPASPLRTLSSVFGYAIDVKSGLVRERDELARRFQIMQHKQRPSAAGQQFTVIIDFSLKPVPDGNPLALTLPGDELAGALFTAAKCLFPKNSFTIGNFPLETWAVPVVAFIRKMGCKVSLQETGRTSFGSVGMIHIQTTVLTGRKLECIPAVAYIPFVPSMAVVAAFAENETVLRGLSDLRADTTDGIEQIEKCIRTLGAHHGEMPDGIVLKGGRDFDGFDLPEQLPAACAAAFAIAGLRCIGTTTINDDTIRQRLPYFENMLKEFGEYRARPPRPETAAGN